MRTHDNDLAGTAARRGRASCDHIGMVGAPSRVGRAPTNLGEIERD
jgi:hypothetical protein